MTSTVDPPPPGPASTPRAAAGSDQTRITGPAAPADPADVAGPADPLPAIPSGPVLTTSACSFEEYRHAFDLSEADLCSRVLDCPGGAAGLTAGVAAVGGSVVAVDPIYGLGPERLRRRVIDDVRLLYARTDAHGAEYDVASLGGESERARLREQTVRTFFADVEAHPERYVAAALPELPFDDGEFDLALTCHLLFTHAEVLGLDEHVAALVELGRVAREVRVYPLVDVDGTPLPELVRAVIARLKKARLTCRIEPVVRPFQRAATTRLVIEHVRRPEA